MDLLKTSDDLPSSKRGRPADTTPILRVVHKKLLSFNKATLRALGDPVYVEFVVPQEGDYLVVRSYPAKKIKGSSFTGYKVSYTSATRSGAVVGLPAKLHKILGEERLSKGKYSGRVVLTKRGDATVDSILFEL